MEALFTRVFNQSILAGWLILAIVMLRIIFRNTPKRVCCALWGIVALRLILPFSFESSLNPFERNAFIVKEAVTTKQLSENTFQSGIQTMDQLNKTQLENRKETGEQKDAEERMNAEGKNESGQVMLSEHTEQLTGSHNQGMSGTSNEKQRTPGESILPVAAHVWCLVGVAILLYGLFGLLRMKRRVCTAVRVEEGVYESGDIETSFLMGIIRPRIYLPRHLKEEYRESILAHERMHRKRLDPVWRLTGYLLLCIYWFHPLCVLAFFFFCRDTEFACDEQTVRSYDAERRLLYSEAIFACSSGRHLNPAALLSFGAGNIKKRIKNVLYRKKAGKATLAVVVVAVFAICFCFFTKSPEKQPEEQPENQNEKQPVEQSVQIVTWEEKQQYMRQFDWEEIQKKQLEPKKTITYTEQAGMGDDQIFCLFREPSAKLEVYGVAGIKGGTVVKKGNELYCFDWMFGNMHGAVGQFYWDEENQLLQEYCCTATGTGVSHGDLCLVRFEGDQLTASGKSDITELIEQADEQVTWEVDYKSHFLKLKRADNGEELYAANFPYVDGETYRIERLLLGEVSSFALGKELYFETAPGVSLCHRDEKSAKEHVGETDYSNMLSLVFPVLLTETDGNIQVSLGTLTDKTQELMENWKKGEYGYEAKKVNHVSASKAVCGATAAHINCCTTKEWYYEHEVKKADGTTEVCHVTITGGIHETRCANCSVLMRKDFRICSEIHSCDCCEPRSGLCQYDVE